MLVLSRKLDESISINNGEITVTVVAIRGDVIRLGITADRSISVHRSEIQDRIDQQARDDAGRKDGQP